MGKGRRKGEVRGRGKKDRGNREGVGGKRIEGIGKGKMERRVEAEDVKEWKSWKRGRRVEEEGERGKSGKGEIREKR